jgi:UDP-2,4-diacetamido-2,4,6-trideoxy-beta-L-altropyranose hydrolase
MRCLALAHALSDKGVKCDFICREHLGNLVGLIRDSGYIVYALPISRDHDVHVSHSTWLGSTQEQDFQGCVPILEVLKPDWVVVDHYALDACWEHAISFHCRRLMVIDDLADRPHECELLLDQTYGRKPKHYIKLVPTGCSLLCGSQYALLRHEFPALRDYSLRRRGSRVVSELLVSMGGVDITNTSCAVLQSLRSTSLPAGCRITVVMGQTAPWLYEVQEQAANMPWSTRVLVGVRNMAQLIADSDLAIGAAGSTTWERCCLGLPSALLVVADNQRYAAQLLARTQAVRIIDGESRLQASIVRFVDDMINGDGLLEKSCLSASSVTDGQGCARVIKHLLSIGSN